MSVGVNYWAPKLRRERIWLPFVDAFRTLVACPPPPIRAVFQQVQTIANA